MASTTATATITRLAPPVVEVAAELSVRLDEFRDPVAIPGCKKKTYVYRHADSHISTAHLERFPDIVDLFRLQLLTVKGLSKSRPASTEYKLKLCGPTPQEARPSILICHPLLDLDIGRLILKKLTVKSLRCQYESITDGTRPCFRVYLFFVRNFLMLGNPEKSFSLYLEKGSLIGAHLVSNDTSRQISTITCGLTFAGDNRVFALTSSHAFEKDDPGESNDCYWLSTAFGFDSSDLEEDNESEPEFSGTDDEYDWTELEVMTSKERIDAELDKPETVKSLENTPGLHANCFEIQPHQVWGRANNLTWARRPNLDWALVEMPGLSLPAPSSFIIPADISKKAASVVAVTRSGLREGTLSHIPSYLGISWDPSVLTKIQTLQLTDGGKILTKGDSGSPVLNRSLDQIYGHITGLNDFGELHVVPLQAVSDQIVELTGSLVKPKFFSEAKLAKPGSRGSQPIYLQALDRLLQEWPEAAALDPDQRYSEWSKSSDSYAPSEMTAISSVFEKGHSIRGSVEVQLGESNKAAFSQAQNSLSGPWPRPWPTTDKSLKGDLPSIGNKTVESSENVRRNPLGNADTQHYSSLSGLANPSPQTASHHQGQPITMESQQLPRGVQTDFTLASHFRRVMTKSYAAFFVLGRVFKMIWTEPAGAGNSGSSRNLSHISTVWVGEQAYSQIRRFVVIRNKGTFSQCVPIHTYRGRGVTKPGLVMHDHGVIHTSLNPANLIPGEDLIKYSIRVEPSGSESLAPASRVNYGKAYAVEHNVKVMDIGMVVENHRHLLNTYFEAAMKGQ